MSQVDRMTSLCTAFNVTFLNEHSRVQQPEIKVVLAVSNDHIQTNGKTYLQRPWIKIQTSTTITLDLEPSFVVFHRKKVSGTTLQHQNFEHSPSWQRMEPCKTENCWLFSSSGILVASPVPIFKVKHSFRGKPLRLQTVAEAWERSASIWWMICLERMAPGTECQAREFGPFIGKEQGSLKYKVYI